MSCGFFSWAFYLPHLSATNDGKKKKQVLKIWFKNKGQEMLVQEKVTWIPPLYADSIRERVILGVTAHSWAAHLRVTAICSPRGDTVCDRVIENVLVYHFSLHMLTKTPFLKMYHAEDTICQYCTCFNDCRMAVTQPYLKNLGKNSFVFLFLLFRNMSPFLPRSNFFFLL